MNLLYHRKCFSSTLYLELPQSLSTTFKSLSAPTFLPSAGSSKLIRTHLNTGDTQRGGIRTREPHHDTLAMVLRNPLADINNLSTNQILSTPTRRPEVDSASFQIFNNAVTRFV